MSKDAKAQIVTIALIAAALAVIAWKQGGLDALRRGADASGFLGSGSQREHEPRDVIYAMLDAARDGKVEAYLACYAGQMERTLRQSHAEMGPERFAAFLRERNQDIKGIAMNAPEETGDETRVRVEYVYADRNEVQMFFLNRTEGAWKIARVGEIRRIETPVPYGTPVY